MFKCLWQLQNVVSHIQYVKRQLFPPFPGTIIYPLPVRCLGICLSSITRCGTCFTIQVSCYTRHCLWPWIGTFVCVCIDHWTEGNILGHHDYVDIFGDISTFSLDQTLPYSRTIYRQMFQNEPFDDNGVIRRHLRVNVNSSGTIRFDHMTFTQP